MVYSELLYQLDAAVGRYEQRCPRALCQNVGPEFPVSGRPL